MASLAKPPRPPRIPLAPGYDAAAQAQSDLRNEQLRRQYLERERARPKNFIDSTRQMIADTLAGVGPGQEAKPIVVDQHGVVAAPALTPVALLTHSAAPVTPAGTPHPAGQPADVAGLQRFLRAHGYDVTVDGMLGPQTSSAATDWRSNRNPSHWNQSHGTATVRNAHARSGAAASSPPGAPGPPALGRVPSRGAPGAAVDSAVPLFRPPPQATLAELLAQAATVADSAISPQEAVFKQQREQALADAERRATFARDTSAALADVLKSQGPAVEDIYHHAGADQAALASGFSGDLRTTADNAAADTNALLASIGAPAGQMIGTDKSHDAANVLYGTGGYIPGTALAREGAAFAADAAELPQTAIAGGEANARAALDAGNTDARTIEQQIAALEAQRPGLTQSALQNLQQLALQNRQQAIDEYLAQLTGVQRQTDVASSREKAAVDQAQLDLETRKTLAALSGYDPVTGVVTPEGHRLIQAQQRINAGTAKQRSSLRVAASADAQKAFYGVSDPNTGNWVQAPLSYQEALSRMAAAYGLDIAQQALNAYWTQAGYDAQRDSKGNFTGWAASGRGRPTVPYQLRVKAAKPKKR